MINIIIADDHPMFIDGVKTALEAFADIRIAGEATDGLQLLQLLDKIKADVVLLDINMPGMDGLQAAAEIKKLHPGVKIIMLTQYDENRFMTKCRGMGVEGYLLKESDGHDLAKAVRNVHHGGIQYLKGNHNRRDFPVPGLTDDLLITGKEKEVLQLIAEDKTNKEIAEEMKIAATTVKTYRQRMFLKTGIKSITGLLAWAFRKRIIK